MLTRIMFILQLLVAAAVMTRRVLALSSGDEPSTFATENGTVYGYKMVMFRNGSETHATPDIPVITNFTSFTVSMWAKNIPSNNRYGYHDTYLFTMDSYYNNTNSRYYYYNKYVASSALYIYRGKLYLKVCGSSYQINNIPSIGSHILLDQWIHFIYSYDRYYLMVWINGKLHRSFYYSCYSTVHFNVTLGKSRYDITEIAYANVYPFAIKTNAQAQDLYRVVGSDPKALVPWSSFLHGKHAGSILIRDSDILFTAGSEVRCNKKDMKIILYRRSFRHLHPARMSLKHPSCNVTSYTNETITFVTTWDKCGTSRHFDKNSTTVIYTNWVYPDFKIKDSRKARPVAFGCRFQLSTIKHSFISAYWLKGTSDIIHHYKNTTKAIPLQITLYHDSNFVKYYSEDEYPLQASNQERIYASIRVPNQYKDVFPQKLSLRISSCFLNFAKFPTSRPKKDLFVNGKAKDNVKVHASPTSQEKRFSFLATELKGRSEQDVYLHCYMISSIA